ncbi:hypothetical protein ACWGLE_22100 [Streptomyces sp. NPDC055897]
MTLPRLATAASVHWNAAQTDGAKHHESPAAPPARSLLPRPFAQRPDHPAHLRALEARRRTINRAALEHPGPVGVLLYALTLSGQSPSDDLAAARGYSTAHPRLLVHDHIADVAGMPSQLDARADDPLLRRGYARAVQMIADPSCPVRGIIAVSRTAITHSDRLYEDQLAWLSRNRAGLWLVRGESAF